MEMCFFFSFLVLHHLVTQTENKGVFAIEYEKITFQSWQFATRENENSPLWRKLKIQNFNYIIPSAAWWNDAQDNAKLFADKNETN